MVENEQPRSYLRDIISREQGFLKLANVLMETESRHLELAREIADVFPLVAA